MNKEKSINNALDDAIQKLTLKDFDGLVFPTKVSTTYRRQQLINYIKNIPSIKKLGDAQRNLFVSDDLGIVADGNGGLVELYIEHHGKRRSFIIKGFMPDQVHIEWWIKKIISILDDHVLDDLSNTTQLASTITKQQVLDLFKSLPAISKLTPYQLNYIVLSNFTITPNDNEGTLKVEVAGHGATKIFNITDFISK